MARTESLEALGRDYAINFGSQSVSSNREQPADPKAEPLADFARWCNSPRFDSRELSTRAHEALAAARPAEPAPDLTAEEEAACRYIGASAIPTVRVEHERDFIAGWMARAALGPAPLVFPPSPCVHQSERDGEAVQRPSKGNRA